MKILVTEAKKQFPYTLNDLRQDNPGTSFPAKMSDVSLARHHVYPVQDDKPSYNAKTHKLVQKDPDQFQVIDGVYHTAYDIVSLTEEEFNARQESGDQIDQQTIKKLLKKQFDALTVPDEEINDYASLFDPFRVGESVQAGDKRQYESEVWQVIQAHTTQIDWLPPDVPALWKRVHDPAVIPAWVQPTGAHDAYNIGDKVTHDGKTWESTINANTTVPGTLPVHGYWVEVI